jgi:O-6-methylguanine DNA methyltransferase
MLNKKLPKTNETEFARRVRAVVVTIPAGQTLSYKAVAKKAGSPNAARAVGTIMANNFDKSIPCHRVIKADGSVGSYNRGGPAQKRALLISEGVVL